MLVAKVIDGAVVELQDYRAMFPDTSFPASGPNADFYVENGLLPVSGWVAHDTETQYLTPCAPYINDGTVYTVTAVAKPEVTDAP